MYKENPVIFTHEFFVLVESEFVSIRVDLRFQLFIITFCFLNFLMILGHCLPLFGVIILLQEFSITCSRLLVLLVAWPLIREVLFMLASTIKAFICLWGIYFIQNRNVTLRILTRIAF